MVPLGALPPADLEDDRRSDRLVDRGEHALRDVVLLGFDLEDLDLGHLAAAREVDRGLGELVGPGDALVRRRRTGP